MYHRRTKLGDDRVMLRPRTSLTFSTQVTVSYQGIHLVMKFVTNLLTCKMATRVRDPRRRGGDRMGTSGGMDVFRA